MIEIVIHGLGGQGAVTAAQILATAAFYDGKYSQAFPMFGVERRGTPVQAFVRISDKKINLRSQIYEPDYNIILEPKLIEKAKSGRIIINSKEKIKNAYCFDAGQDFVNTVMIVVFAKITKLVSKDSLLKAIGDRFKSKPEALKKNKEILEKVWNKQ
ncbi:MAG: 2-oxoacid:acceptor oxidoreductase family protein [Nanoarchaeota archaeon]|nr:2-oxoacid:acceptor oxidoreductase family protein [Nanoarchaeota archaeon]